VFYHAIGTREWSVVVINNCGVCTATRLEVLLTLIKNNSKKTQIQDEDKKNLEPDITNAVLFSSQ